MSKTKKNVTLVTASQVDGKAQPNTAGTPNSIYGSLDQILGENISVYKARDVVEYRQQIADMNQTDLQSHALKIGLIPVEDRKVLVARLVQEFERWQVRMLPQGSVAGGATLADMNENVRKILREGA